MIDPKEEQDFIWNALSHFDELVDIPRIHPDLPQELEDLERERITEAMKVYHNNRTRTAKALGIGRTCLIAKLKKYELV